MSCHSALITGGSSGIGKAIATILYQQNWNVVIASKSKQSLAKAHKEITAIGSLGSLMTVQCDVTSESSVNNLVYRVCEYLKRVDVLITSAGIAKASSSKRVMPHPFCEFPLEEWQEVLDVNLTGVFLTNKAICRIMIEQGYGQILNICSSTSKYGLKGQPFAPAYSASKFAVLGFTESLARHVAKQGIIVQTIFPGPVSTPLISDTALSALFDYKQIAANSFSSIIADLIVINRSSEISRPHILPF